MNGPPSEPEAGTGLEHGPGPDPLDRAYSQASARDTARPAPRVRAAILAQARTSARSAANDSRWHWQAAAGIAAVGLVGVLSWHFIRVAPPELVASTATRAPEPPTATALQAASAPPVVSPAVLPAAPAAASPSAAGAPARLAEQSESRSAPAALRAADAVVGDAAERESDRVLHAVRAQYPELFDQTSHSSGQSAATVTIALNADGTVYASTRSVATRSVAAARALAPGDAAALIAQAFGSDIGALAHAGVTTTEEGVTVIYGIRAAGR